MNASQTRFNYFSFHEGGGGVVLAVQIFQCEGKTAYKT